MMKYNLWCVDVAEKTQIIVLVFELNDHDKCIVEVAGQRLRDITKNVPYNK